MSIVSPFTGWLRSALGVAEHEGAEAVAHAPLHETMAAEQKLDHLVHALQRAGESADRQVEVLDGLAQALPALTEQVTALTARVTVMSDDAAKLSAKLDQLVNLLAPLGAAEHELSRFERIFRRRRYPAVEGTSATPEPVSAASAEPAEPVPAAPREHAPPEPSGPAPAAPPGPDPAGEPPPQASD